MSLIKTPDLSSLGSLNMQPFLAIPPLANFIAEWAALVPLVCHLASYRHPRQLSGRAALLGRISIALFPKLGVLAGVSRLLRRGPEFLDIASTLGSSSRKVWDVKWGGTFLCANGAASSLLAESLICHGNAVIKVTEAFPPMPQKTLSTTTSAFNFRRYQTLHILRFSKSGPSSSWLSVIDRVFASTAFAVAASIIKIVLIVVLCLFGSYGTAIILLSSSITQLVLRGLTIKRPAGFLGNNETHDGCMLVAAHQNSSTWYLFVGDRGIVDSLLNKTMIEIPEQKVFALWFMTAHVVQLIAMTFVACQKGWDGVCLLVLLLFSVIIQVRLKGDSVTKIFCESNGVVMQSASFEFSGRTPMLGAIQILSKTKSWQWMDEIIAPCLRRDAWAQTLSREETYVEAFEGATRPMSRFDSEWVWKNMMLAAQAAALMQQTFRESSAEIA
ncbi:hypothetical protein BJ875DRAFT_399400 [Amylocarpus encephaloides]|uniref:Uncharacterized protein n=1 Tax=Amylocarpus encephaloides TaxID=45428 RepID=A0A9P7YKI0_9HELO|nr:hypothetical protein BJ875DRAFT_399400 [Amylocarpus encephaloides]